MPRWPSRPRWRPPPRRRRPGPRAPVRAGSRGPRAGRARRRGSRRPSRSRATGRGALPASRLRARRASAAATGFRAATSSVTPEREDEDAREHELVHRRVHARVEREVRAVEVVEAVSEAGPEGRERMREAEGRPWRSSRHGTRSTPTAIRAATTVATTAARPRAPAAARRGQPRWRAGEARARVHSDPTGCSRRSHATATTTSAGALTAIVRPALRMRRLRSRPRRAAQRRDRLPDARRQPARLPPGGAGARDPAGAGVRRSSPPRRGRARRHGA